MLFSAVISIGSVSLLQAAPSATPAQAPTASMPSATPGTAQPAAAQSGSGQPMPSPPAVTARAFVLMDYHSGETLAGLNADQRVEPASLTKVMTGYAVFKALSTDKVKLSDTVTVSEKAWRTGGSRSFIKVGTRVSLEDLIKGMIIQSGNDATVAIAEHVAGSEEGFVTLMNHYAQDLGMKDSHFTNSTGLPDPQLYVTASDMARLARAVIAEFPEYYKWYALKEFTYNGITQYNRNKLLWRDGNVDGMKTGHTETAGYCLVASAQREDMRLISVVFGTKSENIRAKESQELLNYGFRTYETHRLYASATPLSTVRIWKGAARDLPLGVGEDLYLTVPRGQYKNLKAALEIDKTIMAPVAKGQRHGNVTVSLGDKVLIAHPLIALQDVARGSLWRRMIDTIKLWFN